MKYPLHFDLHYSPSMQHVGYTFLQEHQIHVLCRVITVLSSHSGINRVKVFLVVTCSLCVKVSNDWVRVRAGMQWQQHERDTGRYRAIKTQAWRHHQFSHTATSSGLRPVSFATFSYPAEMYMSNLRLERISQLLSGGMCRFLTSQQFTRVRESAQWTQE